MTRRLHHHDDLTAMWDDVIESIEQSTEGKYEIHVNRAAGTITVIDRATTAALTLMDATGTHFDGAGRVVFGDFDRSYRERAS